VLFAVFRLAASRAGYGTGTNTKMTAKKHKKQQEDRLLKRLSLQERRRQEELRRLILVDPLFKTA